MKSKSAWDGQRYYFTCLPKDALSGLGAAFINHHKNPQKTSPIKCPLFESRKPCF